MPRKKIDTNTRHVRLLRELDQTIEAMAHRENRSFNGQVIQLLLEAISKRGINGNNEQQTQRITIRIDPDPVGASPDGGAQDGSSPIDGEREHGGDDA